MSTYPIHDSIAAAAQLKDMDVTPAFAELSLRDGRAHAQLNNPGYTRAQLAMVILDRMQTHQIVAVYRHTNAQILRLQKTDPKGAVKDHAGLDLLKHPGPTLRAHLGSDDAARATFLWGLELLATKTRVGVDQPDLALDRVRAAATLNLETARIDTSDAMITMVSRLHVVWDSFNLDHHVSKQTKAEARRAIFLKALPAPQHGTVNLYGIGRKLLDEALSENAVPTTGSGFADLLNSPTGVNYLKGALIQLDLDDPDNTQAQDHAQHQAKPQTPTKPQTFAAAAKRPAQTTPTTQTPSKTIPTAANPTQRAPRSAWRDTGICYGCLDFHPFDAHKDIDEATKERNLALKALIKAEMPSSVRAHPSAQVEWLKTHKPHGGFTSTPPAKTSGA